MAESVPTWSAIPVGSITSIRMSPLHRSRVRLLCLLSRYSRPSAWDITSKTGSSRRQTPVGQAGLSIEKCPDREPMGEL